MPTVIRPALTRITASQWNVYCYMTSTFAYNSGLGRVPTVRQKPIICLTAWPITWDCYIHKINFCLIVKPVAPSCSFAKKYRANEWCEGVWLPRVVRLHKKILCCCACHTKMYSTNRKCIENVRIYMKYVKKCSKTIKIWISKVKGE